MITYFMQEFRSLFPFNLDAFPLGLFIAQVSKIGVEVVVDNIEWKNKWLKSAVKVGSSLALKAHSFSQQYALKKKISQLEDRISKLEKK